MTRTIPWRGWLVALAAIFMTAGVTPAQDRGEARRGPEGRRAPARTAEGDTPDPGKPPIAKNDTEKRILAVIDEMTRDRSRRYLSVSPQDGRLLMQVTQMVGAKRVVEVGMSTGYSSLWFCMALKATGGKLISHEIDKGRIQAARENFKKAGVEDIVSIVEGDGHETVKQHKEPIDVIFLDADKEGYIDYLDKLLPLLRPGGVILAHNMRRPRPDPKFVEAITTNPELDTMFLLMDGAGVTVTVKKR